MLNALSRHVALRILVGRACVLFVLATIVATVFKADSPAGVVLFVAVLGWIDIRRRRETLFWANLGYSNWQITTLMASVAVAGELLLTVVVRPLVGTAMQHPR